MTITTYGPHSLERGDTLQVDDRTVRVARVVSAYTVEVRALRWYERAIAWARGRFTS